MRILTSAIAIVVTLSAVAVAGPAEDIGKLVDGQFPNGRLSDYTDDAKLVLLGSLQEPAAIGSLDGPDFMWGKQTIIDRQITLAHDGKTAWVSLTQQLEVIPAGAPRFVATWRTTELVASTPSGWRVIVANWSKGEDNAKVNAAAKAGKLKTSIPKFDDGGDAGLRAAFAKLTTDGVDATAAARTDLVVFGSGPGERTVGGAGFAKAWAAAWQHHLTIVSSVAKLAPSGTTGWVAATVALDKGTGKAAYKVPFNVFCVFDKTAAGEWGLVHVQLSTTTRK